MVKEYHKIETPFERDMCGSKKLILNKFRNPAVEALKDFTWIWTEKIDGTNIRIIWDGHRVSFGGRTEKSLIPTDLFNFLNEYFGGSANEEIFEQMFGEKEVVLYGEGYGNRIQKTGYQYLPNSVCFILFDVMVGRIFLDRSSCKNIAAAFNIEAVPISFIGSINEAIEFVKSKPTSKIAVDKNLVIEGVVGTPQYPFLDRSGNRIITKIKVCDFV